MTTKKMQQYRNKELGYIKKISKTIREVTRFMQRWGFGNLTSEYSSESDRLVKQLSKLNWQNDSSAVVVFFDRMHEIINGIVKHLRDSIPEENDIPKMLLEKSKYVFATLCATGQLEMVQNLGSIAHMILDEAAQATEAETLIALQHKPGKCVLVGDVNQLPATVISSAASRAHFDWSMMQRLSDNHYPRKMLDTQYRMHPEICEWPSSNFYEGRLQTPPALQTRTLAAANRSPLLQRPRSFYDIKSQEKAVGTSYKNIAEAKVIAGIVEHILKEESAYKKSVRDTGGAEAGEVMPLETIGIITFYAPQVDAIKRSFSNHRLPRGVIVSTVDSFQGSECDIIILSCVRNNSRGNIGFLNDYRRLNVAITRPKHCLMVVGNATNLCQQESRLKAMIENMRSKGQLFSQRSLQKLLNPPSPQSTQKAKQTKKGKSNGAKPGKKQQPQKQGKATPASSATGASKSTSKSVFKKKHPQHQGKKAAASGANSGKKESPQQRRRAGKAVPSGSAASAGLMGKQMRRRRHVRGGSKKEKSEVHVTSR